MAINKATRQIKCEKCSELVQFKKSDNLGKCLRDSMYKDPKNDHCEYGELKNSHT
jgi:hypothetical protein